MSYLDFDSLVICNNDFSEDFIIECFSFFHELGIRNFIFTYDFDVARRSIPDGLRTFKTLKPYLHRFQPRQTRIYTAMNVILDQGIAYDKSLRRMALPQSDRIFVNLPIFTGHDWLEADLAHLVYRKHFQPIFTSFERNAITYTDAMLERFSRLPRVVFCMDANYLFSLRSQAKLTNLLHTNAHILPCISNHMSDYVGAVEGFADLKRRLGATPYHGLCRNIHDASVALRKEFTISRRP